LRGTSHRGIVGDIESPAKTIEKILAFSHEVEAHAILNAISATKRRRIPASGKFGRIKVRAF